MLRVLIIGILVLSLGIAGVSTYLIKTFRNPEAIEELEQEAAIPVFKVLVAIKPITLGQQIIQDNVGWQLWAEEALHPAYIVVEQEDEEEERLKDFISSIARSSFVIGEPVLSAKLFKRDEPGYLAGMLESGMRAVSISVKPVTSVTGFIFPGDRVDIMLTHNKIKDLKKSILKEAKRKGKEDELPLFPMLSLVTETVLKNIKIIAVGNEIVSKENKPTNAKTVTVEVTPKQVELIAVAKKMGTLSLSLRSLEEASSAPESVTYTTDIQVSPAIRTILAATNPILKGKTKQDQLIAEQAEALETARNELATAKNDAIIAKQKALTAQKEKAAAQKAAQNAARNAASRKVRKAPRRKAVPVAGAIISIYRGESNSTTDVKLK